MNAPFRLFPQAQHFCSLADYGVILSTLLRLGKPATCLEFGPGWSTLALIEGGAVWIDAAEDDAHWLRVSQQRVAEMAPHVVVNWHLYKWAEPLSIPAIDSDRGNGRGYDFGLIDGPREVAKRPACVAYCLDRCRHVLVPLECCGGDETMRHYVAHETFVRRLRCEFIPSGPLAGEWALLSQSC